MSKTKKNRLDELQTYLMFFFTGFSRYASDIAKEQIKKTPKHVDWDQLPTSDQFERLAPSRKRLTDTVKMIAYRAETALVSIVREKLIRPDDARALVRDLFRSEADVLPDLKQGVLHVRVHPMANPPHFRRCIAYIWRDCPGYPGPARRAGRRNRS